MKNINVGIVSSLLAFILNLISISANAAENIWRYPEVSEAFMGKMDEVKRNSTGPHPRSTNNWVDQECKWSFEYSSFYRVPDYFVVKSKNSDGGRIIKMNPITSTGFNGLANTPVFSDAISGEIFKTSMETQDLRDGSPNDNEVNENWIFVKIFHYGHIQMGDENVYFIVGYKGAFWTPTVLLTWGEDSNVGEPGYTVDDFSRAVLPMPDYPTNKVTLETVTKGNPNGDMPGLYVLVGSDKHVELQKSQDFKAWESTQPPVLIYGRLTAFFFDTPTSGLEFFRAKMRE